MASSTLTPYYSNSSQTTFSLVSTGVDRTIWKVSGRPLATPYSIEVIRKVGGSGQLANDHVQLRITYTGKNATSGKISSAVISLDISIPRDADAVSATQVVQSIGILSSILDDSTALQATSSNRTVLVEGRDL